MSKVDVSLKERLQKHAVCPRIYDNEPIPMRGCHVEDCSKCKVSEKIKPEKVISVEKALRECNAYILEQLKKILCHKLQKFGVGISNTKYADSDVEMLISQLERFVGELEEEKVQK